MITDDQFEAHMGALLEDLNAKGNATTKAENQLAWALSNVFRERIWAKAKAAK